MQSLVLFGLSQVSGSGWPDACQRMAGSPGLVYCERITVTPEPVPVDFVNKRTPMLIMRSTRDALTPYTWSSEMARTFRNSRVVTYVGGTHTPFLGAGSCVDRYGVRYLLKRKRPVVDVACQSILR